MIAVDYYEIYYNLFLISLLLSMRVIESSKLLFYATNMLEHICCIILILIKIYKNHENLQLDFFAGTGFIKKTCFSVLPCRWCKVRSPAGDTFGNPEFVKVAV